MITMTDVAFERRGKVIPGA